MTLEEAISKDRGIFAANIERKQMVEWLASEDGKRAPWHVRDLVDCEATHLSNVILDARAYTSAGLLIKAEVAAEVEGRGFAAGMQVAS